MKALYHPTNRHDLAQCEFLTLLALGALLPAASGQQTKTQETIPLIQMEAVPLRDAIKNLARQARLNYILDPRLEGPWQIADGRPAREPSLNVRWENLTANQALGTILKQHGLILIANPATKIARIAFTNQTVKPVSDSAVAAGTNTVIPLIVMDTVPLPDALRNLAKQAHINLLVDSDMPVGSGASGKRRISDYTLSIRWENVTASQALAAILDNYDLVLVQDAATGTATVAAMPSGQDATPSRK